MMWFMTCLNTSDVVVVVGLLYVLVGRSVTIVHMTHDAIYGRLSYSKDHARRVGNRDEKLDNVSETFFSVE